MKVIRRLKESKITRSVTTYVRRGDGRYVGYSVYDGGTVAKYFECKPSAITTRYICYSKKQLQDVKDWAGMCVINKIKLGKIDKMRGIRAVFA